MYLEGACFLLIFDLIYSPSNLTVNALRIETGLKTMEKLTAKQSILNCIVAIRTIFAQVLSIVQQTGNQDHEGLDDDENRIPVIRHHPAMPIVPDMAQPFKFNDGDALPKVRPDMSMENRDTPRQGDENEDEGSLLDGSFLTDEISMSQFRVDWFATDMISLHPELSNWLTY